MPDLPATLMLAEGSSSHWAIQQAAQHLTTGRPHVQRQRDHVIDHHVSRQMALPDTGFACRVQNRMNPVRRKHVCDHTEFPRLGRRRDEPRSRSRRVRPAHKVKGVEGDYRRGTALKKRRILMAEWAEYCTAASAESAIDQVA